MKALHIFKIKKVFFTALLVSVTTIGIAHSHHYGAKGSNDESTIEDAIKEFTETKNKHVSLKEKLNIITR